MTEVQSNSFGEPTLLLEDPLGDADLEFASNGATTRTRPRNTEDDFTSNGLLGDASDVEEDATMVDTVLEESRVGNNDEDEGFGGTYKP